MKLLNFVGHQMGFTERNRPAEIIIVDIVPVNEIIEIADNADFADDFHIRAKLFLQLSQNRSAQVFSCFDTAAGGFNQRRTSEIVIPLGAHEIEVTGIIKDDVEKMIDGLGLVVRKGMDGMNEVILQVMVDQPVC